MIGRQVKPTRLGHGQFVFILRANPEKSIIMLIREINLQYYPRLVNTHDTQETSFTWLRLQGPISKLQKHHQSVAQIQLPNIQQKKILYHVLLSIAPLQL